MDSIIQRWAKNFGLVVYLNEDISKKDESELERQFFKDKDLSGVKYISKKHALKELREILGSNAPIIEELKENPLPSSFELKLKSKLLEPAFVKNKAEQIEQMSGVEEVQYGEKWLSSLYKLSNAMKIGAIAVGIAIFTAITFITFSTIKIFFYRRKDEIETLKLLGSTRTFIRLPFMIEGFIIGILGGIISSLAIFGIYSFTSIKMIEFLPSIKFFITSLPIQAYLVVPLAGAVVSLVGSFIAAGKIRY
jgi:cell division transport system permease protein